MNFLFVHQNFPAQYVHIAKHLAAAGHQVVFLTQQKQGNLPGVRKIEYSPPRQTARPHYYLAELNAGILNGQAVAAIAAALKRTGFTPDLIVGHNGWGEILFLKDVWPRVPLLGYFEFFYRITGSDMDFDPEFPPQPDDAFRIRAKNAINLLGLDAADWGQAPTEFQRTRYPQAYQRRITVVHEGIDTDLLRPDPTSQLFLRGGVSLSREAEVVTYSARNLEPYRGFHVFMRSVPLILRRRPRAQVVIIGGDDISYGRPPDHHKTYREQMLAELGSSLDLSRIHFLGKLPYQQYRAALQLSSAHVYLTYPFVLSWSLLEAMATGCLVIGSRTAPVEEVVEDGVSGLLVDFLNPEAIAAGVCDALAAGPRLDAVRTAARAAVAQRFDLKRICLPRYLKLFGRLTGTRVRV